MLYTCINVELFSLSLQSALFSVFSFRKANIHNGIKEGDSERLRIHGNVTV